MLRRTVTIRPSRGHDRSRPAPVATVGRMAFRPLVVAFLLSTLVGSTGQVHAHDASDRFGADDPETTRWLDSRVGVDTPLVLACLEALWITRTSQGHAVVLDGLHNSTPSGSRVTAGGTADERAVRLLARAMVELDQRQLGAADTALDAFATIEPAPSRELRVLRLLLKAELLSLAPRRDPHSRRHLMARSDTLYRQAHDAIDDSTSKWLVFLTELAGARLELRSIEGTRPSDPNSVAARRAALDRTLAHSRAAKEAWESLKPDGRPGEAGRRAPSPVHAWLEGEWRRVVAQLALERGWQLATREHAEFLAESIDPVHQVIGNDLLARLAAEPDERRRRATAVLSSIGAFRAGLHPHREGPALDRFAPEIQRVLSEFTSPESDGDPETTAIRALRIVEWIRAGRRSPTVGALECSSADAPWSKRLDFDERVLVHFDLGSSIAIWVIAATGVDLVVHERPAGFDRWIEEVRGGRSSGQRWSSSAWRLLFDALIRPAEAHLAGAERLYFAPYGALRRIPFGCLADDDGFVFERFTTSVLRTALAPDKSDGASPESAAHPSPGAPPPNAKSTRVLALIDPQAPAGRTGLLPTRLPAALDGIRPFVEQLRGPRLAAPGLAQSAAAPWILEGDAARPRALRRLAPGAEYVHIASHGSFDRFDPWRSALFLAADGEEHDGRLTAREFASLDLSASKLVTLSGCETCLMDPAADDLAGFCQAAFDAGATRLLGSLWRVDDRETGDFMKHFYSSLGSGLSPADALRHARRVASRRARGSIHSNPSGAAPYSFTAWILVEDGDR